MSNARVARGRRTNVVVAAWLAKHGWPRAKATFGSEPGRDVKNIDGHAVEVKARRDFRPLEWLRQAQAYAGDDIPCVVMRCDGQGEKSIGDYLVIRRLADDELGRGEQCQTKPSDQALSLSSSTTGVTRRVCRGRVRVGGSAGVRSMRTHALRHR